MLIMPGYGMTAKIFLLILLSMGIHQIISEEDPKPKPKLCLFNFEDCVFTDDWTEQSDTIWPSGKSTGKIAVRVLSMKRPSGRFDSNLIPQEPSGACFSGVSTKTNWDLDGYEYITFPCKGLGNATSYKIILGNSHPHRPDTTYEHSFKVKIKSKVVVQLSLDDFIPNDEETSLNIRNITSFGIQVRGVTDDNKRQSGKSSLIFSKIWATPPKHVFKHFNPNLTHLRRD